MRFIAGHRRQRASELAGFMNMPCIVRNMTDRCRKPSAMTDDNTSATAKRSYPAKKRPLP